MVPFDRFPAAGDGWGDRTYSCCSEGCRQIFLAPEQQMRRMRRRVGIALSGVLALAVVLRTAALIALAAGDSLLSWAPLPQLPWLTWGMWLVLLATPVQVFGGWGFYTGAWAALRHRALNMDMLIALGSSVAYVYSVVVVLAPQWLPVGIDERGVYFEASAVRRLLDLQPASATVIREGQEMTVPAEAVLQADVVLVRPGDKMPADGTPYHQRDEASGDRPPPVPTQSGQESRMFPLHRLPNICCSSGACRDVESWPMGHPQEGWRQLDLANREAIPVALCAFSNQGVGVILMADVPLQQGASALLMMQAHGAGLRHRPVRMCWNRPRPQAPERQVGGLRFEPNDRCSPVPACSDGRSPQKPSGATAECWWMVDAPLGAAEHLSSAISFSSGIYRSLSSNRHWRPRSDIARSPMWLPRASWKT